MQIGRLSNGRRRILSITEVTGLSDNIIATQELYRYEARVTSEGEELDHWESLGIHPHSPKLARFRQTLSGGGFGAASIGADSFGGFGRGGGGFNV